jgi:hypothetical protein
LKPTTKERADALVTAALRLAERGGLRALTHEAVARQAGVSPSLVKVRMGPIASVRRAVMRAAVERRVVRVVAEGLACRDRVARTADAALRQACAQWVAGA